MSDRGRRRRREQVCIFAADPATACAGKGVTPQNVTACVLETHASWMWDFSAWAGSGYDRPSGDYDRALGAATLMGYALAPDALVVSAGAAPGTTRFSCAGARYACAFPVWAIRICISSVRRPMRPLPCVHHVTARGRVLLSRMRICISRMRHPRSTLTASYASRDQGAGTPCATWASRRPPTRWTAS